MINKTWLFFILVFILALIFTNISPLIRRFQIKKELQQADIVPIKEEIELPPVKYTTQDKFTTNLGVENVQLGNLVRQAEDDISDLAHRARQDLRSMYSNINERRYSSIALEIGM